MALRVKLSDVFRATLPGDCGNIGYVGLAPDGSAYHVVVPVDVQIARGVKAGNRPEDGTPFGGYRGWRYFDCLPYITGRPEARERQTRRNARLLLTFAAETGLEIELIE